MAQAIERGKLPAGALIVDAEVSQRRVGSGPLRRALLELSGVYYTLLRTRRRF